MNVQTEAPDPKGSAEFWRKLWSEPVEHNRDSEWLKKVKEKLRDTKQEKVIITVKELKWAIARMSSWKAAGPDHVQGFWFTKAIIGLHSKLKRHLQECVNESTYMGDKRTHSIHHERQEQRNSCRKLHTNCLPSTDVETFDKYILRSNIWTFELPGIIAKWTEGM